MENFTFMRATVFEIAGESARPLPSLVKGVGTKRLCKGRVKVSALLLKGKSDKMKHGVKTSITFD